MSAALLKDKVVFITGGTGSFGHHVVEKLLADTEVKQVVIYSRDEKKQYDMRLRLHDPRLKFVIGDVRDRDQVAHSMRGADYVFHAAALKQVPNCEFFPYEAVKTNIIGTQNVLDAAESIGVKKVVALSTDKAVYPINAMGMTKGLLEKLILGKARGSPSSTVYCAVRYGNVMYSRGSVIPLFIEQLKAGKPITLTHPDMTRFLLPLPIAIDLVLYALEHGENGDILVRKSPAATVDVVADAILDIFGSKHGKKTIGVREGEKLHETLISQEDLLKAEDRGNYYAVKNLKKLDYDKFFTEGLKSEFPAEGYTSENTQRLDFEETKKLLLSLREVQEQLK